MDVMANLIYTAITSLDGYVVDADGNFDWAAPDEEVHAFVNDLERGIGTYLYGRRLYEVMRLLGDRPPARRPAGGGAGLRPGLAGREQDHLLQHAGVGQQRADQDRADLRSRSRPAAEGDADRDLSVGGPGLAASAIKAGLVDEWHQFVNPVIVGGGTAFLPDDVRVQLELLDEHRFGSGVVHLHYRTRELDWRWFHPHTGPGRGDDKRMHV